MVLEVAGEVREVHSGDAHAEAVQGHVAATVAGCRPQKPQGLRFGRKGHHGGSPGPVRVSRLLPQARPARAVPLLQLEEVAAGADDVVAEVQQPHRTVALAEGRALEEDLRKQHARHRAHATTRRTANTCPRCSSKQPSYCHAHALTQLQRI
jgi:hypothetical protein